MGDRDWSRVVRWSAYCAWGPVAVLMLATLVMVGGGRGPTGAFQIVLLVVSALSWPLAIAGTAFDSRDLRSRGVRWLPWPVWPLAVVFIPPHFVAPGYLLLRMVRT